MLTGGVKIGGNTTTLKSGNYIKRGKSPYSFVSDSFIFETGYSHIPATKNLIFLNGYLLTHTLPGTQPSTRPRRCGVPGLR